MRSHVIAQALTELGSAPAIISTREPDGVRSSNVRSLARSVTTPRRRPRLGISLELIRLIRNAAVSSDLIIISGAMFLPAVVLSRSRLPIVWDTVECQTLHYRRLPRTPLNMLRLTAWTWLERWAAKRSAIAIAIGDEECQAWLRLRPELTGKLVTVDHCAPAQASTRSEGRRLLESELGRPVTGPIVLFVGTLRAKHNAAAARWLLEQLAPTLAGNVTLVICGPGSETLRPRKTRATVATLGYMDNVDALIAGADICLAPLASGAGVHTKVLHYLAHGRPVLGTPFAFEGLVDAPGLVTASLTEFPRCLAALLDRPEARDQAADRSRRQKMWLETRHSHSHIVQQLRMALSVVPPR